MFTQQDRNSAYYWLYVLDKLDESIVDSFIDNNIILSDQTEQFKEEHDLTMHELSEIILANTNRERGIKIIEHWDIEDCKGWFEVQQVNIDKTLAHSVNPLRTAKKLVIDDLDLYGNWDHFVESFNK